MIGRVMNNGTGAAGGLAFALAGLAMAATPQPAVASDWGCQVVLCLATPGPPTTYAACVPPITRLWNILAVGGSFPTCAGVGTRIKAVRHGYDLTVTRADGTTARYNLDTRTRTVAQQ